MQGSFKIIIIDIIFLLVGNIINMGIIRAYLSWRYGRYSKSQVDHHQWIINTWGLIGAILALVTVFCVLLFVSYRFSIANDQNPYSLGVLLILDQFISGYLMIRRHKKDFINVLRNHKTEYDEDDDDNEDHDKK